MTDSEKRAWDKVIELEDLCKSLSLMLKERDDALNEFEEVHVRHQGAGNGL